MKAAIVFGILLASACAPARGSGQAEPALLDRTWQLFAIGREAEPLGEAERPPTLQLDSKERRASGSGGCNRFSGGYEQAADRLSFGPLISTRMACGHGMGVEASYLDALGKVASFAIEDGELVLRGGGAELRFRAAAP